MPATDADIFAALERLREARSDALNAAAVRSGAVSSRDAAVAHLQSANAALQSALDTVSVRKQELKDLLNQP